MTHSTASRILFSVLFLALLVTECRAQLLTIIPPDTTTYYGGDESGQPYTFRRSPDSLMIPGTIMLRFRREALDSLMLSASFENYYHPHRTGKGKGDFPLSGPYGSSGAERGYPAALCSILLGERFYFDSSDNIVRDSSLKHFFELSGGHFLKRMTTASPLDTSSVTRIGDTIGCDFANWMVLSFDSTQNPLLVCYLLLKNYQQFISGAWPDYRGGVQCFHAGDTASDARYLSCQHNTNMINAEAAWYYEVGDPHVLIGIADGGVDFRHPDFGDTAIGVGHKFVVGWNWTIDSAGKWLFSQPGHGTQMAGIMGALTNNNLGSLNFDTSVAGIAGGWGTLLPMSGPRGRGVSMAIGAADIGNDEVGFISSLFEMSARSPYSPFGWGVHVINISEGGVDYDGQIPDSPPHAAINYAFENNVVVVASQDDTKPTGDNGSRFFPAEYEEPWVINVGGSIPGKTKLPQCDFGYNMDFLAPSGASDGCGTGWNMNFTTHKDNPSAPFTYGPSGGTSASAANTSGAVALLESHFYHQDTNTFKHITPEDYQGIIKASAWRLDAGRLSDSTKRNSWVDSSGWGHLDIGKAFEMLDPDLLAYPHSGYTITHYSFDDTTSMTFGTWIELSPLDTVHGAINTVTFGPSYSPNLSSRDTIATYGSRLYQLHFMTDSHARYRTVDLTVTLPKLWEMSDSAPLFAWGRSGAPSSKTGWNLSHPYNYETGWSQVQNGTGGDTNLINEGIFHNDSTTFVVRTGQWEITNDSTHLKQHVPPDSLLGVNFSVFGRQTSFAKVNESTSSPDGVPMTVAMVPSRGIVVANYYSASEIVDARIDFFDVLGRLVGSRDLGHQPSGWNRVEYSSGGFSSGMYLCRVSGTGISEAKSFLLIR